MDHNKMLAEVLAHYKRFAVLDEVGGLLHWDQRTKMPKKGLSQRAEALALIEGTMHQLLVDPGFVEKVGTLAENSDSLDDDGKVQVARIKRFVDQAVKVPTELVEAISREVSHANAAWAQARSDSDYSKFSPNLQKVLDLRIEEAAALGFADNPYDAMVDHFEPESSEASIAAVFEDLRKKLVPFVAEIQSKGPRSAALVRGPQFDVETQRAFGLSVIKQMGFDFDAGRQDISVHPFCAGTGGDVRITTRFYPDDLRPALFGMMHEAGHALYEQGLPENYRYSPLGQSVSLAIHESQSRMWENLVGRSLPFWKYMFPKLREAFPNVYANVDVKEFYKAANIIEGSLIRVEADEATYQLHIILRFEIESDLVNRRVSVADLPAYWTEKVAKYLGIDVPDDAQGVLQDVHWSEGLFGYFPTYCLGNLYSAQFFAKAKQELGDLDAMLERGELLPLRNWLKEKIHSQGMRYNAEKLVEVVTGKPLSADDFMTYLNDKFSPLYGL